MGGDDKVYVSGRANNHRRQGNANNREIERERFMIPSEYDGNALRDPEALARAEEAFRRGYVFEEKGEKSDPESEIINPDESEIREDEVHTMTIPEPEEAVAEKNSDEEIVVNEEPAVTASAVPIREKGHGDGLISGLFHGITTEHIIIIAAILILWDSRADDELMIMLAILLFC